MHKSLYRQLILHLKYIKAEIKTIFVDNFKRINNVLKEQAHLDYLKLIVYFDELSPQENNQIKAYGTHKIKIVSFNELMVTNFFFQSKLMCV